VKEKKNVGKKRNRLRQNTDKGGMCKAFKKNLREKTRANNKGDMVSFFKVKPGGRRIRLTSCLTPNLKKPTEWRKKHQKSQ